MKFDIYDINKILYDEIRYMQNRTKLNFSGFGAWDNPRIERFYFISFHFSHGRGSDWRHSPYSFNKRFHIMNSYSYYDFSKQFFIINNHESSPNLYFMICEKDVLVSLRELILFMIYMNYFSKNSCNL